MRSSKPDIAGVDPALSSFALDHLTVIETTPQGLAEVAAEAGYARICAFVRSIDGLGGPAFDLTSDAGERRATRASLDALSLTVDVAYPFTVSDRTGEGDFERDLACAAELGACFANLLIFARDEGRILAETARFHERAREYGLETVVEMVPASSVRTLTQAAGLVRSLGAPPDLRINLDALHLYRSGETPEAVAPFRAEIGYLQVCDGPLETPAEGRRVEASLQRLMPGAGAFDLGALMRLLPAVPASLEIPDGSARAKGVGPVERARGAMEAMQALLLV